MREPVQIHAIPNTRKCVVVIAQPTQHVQPAQPVQHAQPAQPAQHVQLVQHAQPAQPAQPAHPVLRAESDEVPFVRSLLKDWDDSAENQPAQTAQPDQTAESDKDSGPSPDQSPWKGWDFSASGEDPNPKESSPISDESYSIEEDSLIDNSRPLTVYRAARKFPEHFPLPPCAMMFYGHRRSVPNREQSIGSRRRQSTSSRRGNSERSRKGHST